MASDFKKRQKEIWLLLLADDLQAARLTYSATEIERALWDLNKKVSDIYQRFKEEQRQAAGK